MALQSLPCVLPQVKGTKTHGTSFLLAWDTHVIDQGHTPGEMRKAQRTASPDVTGPLNSAARFLDVGKTNTFVDVPTEQAQRFSSAGRVPAWNTGFNHP